MSLQQLLERKDQVKVNLNTTDSFLKETDGALQNISGLLASARGSALSVADSTSSQAQRTAVAQEVSNYLRQIVTAANTQFRGRYLFAGSNTTYAPFDSDGKLVTYHGNRGALQTYSDNDQLFQTNSDGDSVFGAISDPVRVRSI
jgi:flagellar hook-associated protein 3 FlgL